ncbi:MAG: hypothetical protein LLG14_11590, partial [Nocardiaceae bacterium]|nr:hypothetical protein [Nocardiaceae bacterium]
TADDVKTLRYLMDLALQPEDSWDGFFFVPVDQFREGAVRYQLNFVSYASAMYQYTRTPAFSGYLAEAQRNMITKMTHRKVWSYWSLENLWGNLRWNPDPIVDDNVMYSGYLGLMLGLYETTTGDSRYREPGSLQLRWSDRKVFEHDSTTIAAALADNFARARSKQFPCEPNWIYPMCNTFGINSLIVEDRLRGTNRSDAVVAQVRESYENGDYCEPNGRLTTARSEYFGFRHPMVGNMGDGITTYFLNSIVPDIARRTWWLNDAYHLRNSAGIADPKNRSWNLIDPGNYGVFTDRFTRAVLAANAREFGYHVAADSLVESMRGRLIEQDGAVRYKGLSVWGNLYLAMTQFGREDAFRGLVTNGFPAEWRTGPRLCEVAYPDVIVTYAVTDGESLDLVLVPGDGPRHTTIAFDRLRPGRTYRVSGAMTNTLTADLDGKALVQINLDERLEVRLTPAG